MLTYPRILLPWHNSTKQVLLVNKYLYVFQTLFIDPLYFRKSIDQVETIELELFQVFKTYKWFYQVCNLLVSDVIQCFKLFVESV